MNDQVRANRELMTQLGKLKQRIFANALASPLEGEGRTKAVNAISGLELLLNAENELINVMAEEEREAPIKEPLTLEQSGLIIELFRGNQTFAVYSACTHGGWAKYLGQPNAESEPTANFELKSEIIEDANKIAKYYNAPLLVCI